MAHKGVGSPAWQLRKRKELANDIEAELVQMEKKIADVDDFGKAAKATEHLEELWKCFNEKVLNLEAP